VSTQPDPQTPKSLSVTITTRTLLIAALVVLLGWAVVSVRDALLIVFLGIFIGLVFEAPTRLLVERTGMGRGLAATFVVLGAAVVVVLLGLLLLVPLAGGVRDFIHNLPSLVADLRDELPSSIGDSGAAEDAQAGATTLANGTPDGIASVLGVAGDAAHAALTGFTLVFIALFFILDSNRLKGALASILPPAESARTDALWERITRTVSRWAIGAATIAVIAGTVQGGTAWILGSSYALALGVIAGFLDLIPNIGATIAGFILTLTIYAEEGLTQALIMLAVVLIYQQVENNLLTPTIQGKATNISGFFVMTSVTLFGALLGVVGALIAVPVTASLQVVVGEYTRERRARLAALAPPAPPEPAPEPG
jgi:predicted PurR-regulated permease PerM